jgi:hypothetical protein
VGPSPDSAGFSMMISTRRFCWRPPAVALLACPGPFTRDSPQSAGVDPGVTSQTSINEHGIPGSPATAESRAQKTSNKWMKPPRVKAVRSATAQRPTSMTATVSSIRNLPCQGQKPDAVQDKHLHARASVRWRTQTQIGPPRPERGTGSICAVSNIASFAFM